MKIHTLKYLSLLVFTGILFTQCKQDDIVLQDGWDKFDRELELAAPLIKGSFSASDLLEVLDSTALIYTDSEGLIHLKYEDTITNNYDDVIAIDDVTYDKTYDLSAPLLKSSKALTGLIVDTIKLNERADQRFDSLWISGGMLNLAVFPPSGTFTGTYKVIFPQIVRNNVPLEFTGDMDNSQTLNQDISGYVIYPKQALDSSYFEMHIEVYDLAPTGTLGATDLSIEMTITDMLPGDVFGYFGQAEVLNETRDFEFGFLKEMEISDMLQLKGIELVFTIQNYFGIEFLTTLNNIVGRNTGNGNEVNLDLTTNNTITVEPALWATPVEPMQNQIVINETNSNLDDLINIFPDQLSFGLVVETNPSGSVNNNFVSSQLKLEGILSLDVPFWFKTSSYNRVDTIGFDVESLLDSTTIEAVNYISLNYEFINGFPFQFESQGYFVDENFQVVDSLFDDGERIIWEAGALDATGKVTADGTSNGIILLENDKVKKLNQDKVKHLLLSSSIETSGGGTEFVKLYEQYGLQMKLGIEVQTGDIPTN